MSVGIVIPSGLLPTFDVTIRSAASSTITYFFIAVGERCGTNDPNAVHDFWFSLVAASEVCTRVRGEFRGKARPVRFFWGAFDLAVTRFSGRPAPEHPGGVANCPDAVIQEAYCAEVSSCGYWPGSREEGLFYSYAYPEPDRFRATVLSPPEAAFDADLGEFVLPHSAVRRAADPDALLRSAGGIPRCSAVLGGPGAGRGGIRDEVGDARLVMIDESGRDSDVTVALGPTVDRERGAGGDGDALAGEA